MAPLAAAPPARADVFDEVIEQVVAPFLDATGGIDGAALSSPAAWGAFFDATHGDAVVADVYAPLHTGIEDWIHSGIGQQVDGVINQLFGSYVIGDGTPGTAGDPDGGAGGWLFGDGGAGWDSDEAGVAGGDGGAAGLFGTGGAGGDGGAGAAGGSGGAGGSVLGVGGVGGDGGDGAVGAAGGAGGDGGDGTGLFGSGGDGGSGGDSGVGSTELPALGGAGGSGGLLGSHGDVGHYGTLTGVTPSASSDLETTGPWFTDSDGRVVMLHGVKLIDKSPPFEPSAIGFNDAKAEQLEAAGINAVRLGVEWAGVEPEPGVFNDDYLASLAQTVQILADHHIRVILDMHQDGYSGALGHNGAPDWAVDTGGLPNPDLSFPLNYPFSPAGNHAWDAFWSNTQVQDGVKLENSYARMWEYVADYFKGNPDVVGYEIMNEPWPGSQWLASVLGSPHFDQQVLTPFYNQVDSAIRAVDPNTPVLFEPNLLFGNTPVNTQLGTVDDPNSVFAFHPYCITTALLGDTSFGCSAYEQLIDGWAQDYANAHDIPAMITEFGNTNNDTVITTAMDEANQHGFGWLFWPLGLYASDANLQTLAQPYPEVVAGTPDSWSFDNGAFQLSYSTEMADGSGQFAAGSQTEISVPASQFPNGYQVSVTGGHVISAANAPELVIASNGGADTVDVTVSPVAAG